jgi:hypothetical protein
VFNAQQRDISYVLRSVCINLGIAISIAALFIPKIFIIARGSALCRQLFYALNQRLTAMGCSLYRC